MPACSKCSYLNPETARFCQSCGSQMEVVQPTVAELPLTPSPRRGLTYGQKWAVGGGVFVIILIIVALGSSYSPNRAASSAATVPYNMKISVISNICWSGSVGGVGSSSTKDGCDSNSWSFPGETIVSAVVQLMNKCSTNPYTYQETCEAGKLDGVFLHKPGGIYNPSSKTPPDWHAD